MFPHPMPPGAARAAGAGQVWPTATSVNICERASKRARSRSRERLVWGLGEAGAAESGKPLPRASDPAVQGCGQVHAATSPHMPPTPTAAAGIASGRTSLAGEDSASPHAREAVSPAGVRAICEPSSGGRFLRGGGWEHPCRSPARFLARVGLGGEISRGERWGETQSREGQTARKEGQRGRGAGGGRGCVGSRAYIRGLHVAIGSSPCSEIPRTRSPAGGGT